MNEERKLRQARRTAAFCMAGLLASGDTRDSSTIAKTAVRMALSLEAEFESRKKEIQAAQNEPAS